MGRGLRSRMPLVFHVLAADAVRFGSQWRDACCYGDRPLMLIISRPSRRRRRRHHRRRLDVDRLLGLIVHHGGFVQCFKFRQSLRRRRRTAKSSTSITFVCSIIYKSSWRRGRRNERNSERSR
jgi:hypothetical protein